jgi:hypothetical protein
MIKLFESIALLPVHQEENQFPNASICSLKTILKS